MKSTKFMPQKSYKGTRVRSLIISLFILLTLYTDYASALSSKVYLSPMVLPTFLDLSLSGEVALHPRNTAIVNATYNEKKCHDCRYSGSSYGKGMSLAYRHYLTSVDKNSWFGHFGVGLFEGKSKETSSGKKSVKTMNEAVVQIGRRNHLQNSFFYEFGLGGIFRSNDTTAGNYTGYRRSTPVINLAIGVNF